MRIVIFSAALISTFVLAEGLPARAGTIDFALTVQGSGLDPTTGFYTQVNGGGTDTGSDGFPSLAGTPPGALGISFGRLQLVDLTTDGSRFHETFSGVPGSSSFIDFSLDGSVVGSSSDLVIHVDGDLATESAVVTGDFTLSGVAGSPFYEDVLRQTGGTGLMDLRSDPFNPLTPNGQISITGQFLTATPEPSSAILALSAVACGLLVHRRCRRAWAT